jgi:hypothetical protein
VLNNRFGCDSVVYLDLIVNPVDETVIYGKICQGEVFSFAGNTYSTGGTYAHVFSNRFGCDSLVSLNLGVMPLPVVNLGGDRLMFTSESLVLDAGAGYASYVWNTGETGQTITIDAKRGKGPATYAVTVTDINGCSNSDESSILLYDDFSADKGDGPSFKLFPNPSQGIVMMLLEKLSGKYLVRVTDEQGRVVFADEKTTVSEKFVRQLNLTFLPPGIYQVTILTNGQSTGKKLVIAPNGP